MVQFVSSTIGTTEDGARKLSQNFPAVSSTLNVRTDDVSNRVAGGKWVLGPG